MKTIAYTCPFVPAEWIAAHGLRPMRMLPASPAQTDPVKPTAGLCEYARAFLNAAGADGACDAVVFTTVCDQMRRAAECLSRDRGRPVFLMNVPTTWQTAAAVRLYLDELRRLGRFLVRCGGRAPGEEGLIGVMREYDAARSRLRALRGTLPPRACAEAAAEFHRSGRLPDPAAGAPRPAGGIPVAIVGGPLLAEQFVLFDLIEEFGGQVALDATAGGELTLPAPLDRRRLPADPLAELAEAYFGSIPHAFRRPNSLLYAWLKRELAACGARGILFHRHLWCDLWHAELPRLKEWTPRPVLEVDFGEDDGSRSRPAGRIQAFLEMLR